MPSPMVRLSKVSHGPNGIAHRARARHPRTLPAHRRGPRRAAGTDLDAADGVLLYPLEMQRVRVQRVSDVNQEGMPSAGM